MASMSEQGFSSVLEDIAKNMKTDEQTDDLGLELEIDQSAIDGYKVANQCGKVHEGTHAMLKEWSSHQHQHPRTKLKQALERVGRKDLCKRIFSIPDIVTSESDELNNLREYLYYYGQTEAVHIGLFGLIGSGKSALANSLNYALTGTYVNCANEQVFGTQETRIKQRIRITKLIHVMDNIGMRDLNIRQIEDDIIPQICGKRGSDNRKRITGGPVIHCPVFVCDLGSWLCARDKLMEFFIPFSKAVLDHYGRHLMIVILHKKDLQQNGNLPDVKESFRSYTLVPVDNLWVFENYTRDNHVHDNEKSIDFLKFLKRCVEVGERNIHFDMETGVEKQSPLDRMLSWYHS